MAAAKLGGKPFILAANVLFGEDKYDEKRKAFVYDASSKKIACGEAEGGTYDGNLIYTGTKDFE